MSVSARVRCIHEGPEHHELSDAHRARGEVRFRVRVRVRVGLRITLRVRVRAG